MGNRVEALQQKKEHYEGTLIQTNSYGFVKVLEYNDSRNVLVEFVDTGFKKTVKAACLMAGQVKDNSTSYLFEVDKITMKGSWSNHNKVHCLWNGMLSRCYDTIRHVKTPTYRDCTVSENFKDLNYFKDWCYSQIGFANDGWCLDKDILLKGNKLYSEDTCCFVPHEINTIILQTKKSRGELPIGVYLNKKTGKYRARISKNNKQISIGTYHTIQLAFDAYKQAKEDYIKEVANKYKGLICSEVYDALMNWKINIDD